LSNLIGQSLGRYHILEQLGEGGMATVYKAYDTRLERDVAVKIIRRGAFPADHLEQILKRFERESKALARLFHPNIVKVLDYGEYEGSPYMVLEYLPGGTLKQKLGKPINWQDSIQLLLPVARALEYAHEQGIIHRDVKPSNILLTVKNQPLLTDFGIAKILESRELTTLTGTGVGVGTPEYMAPEQWTGKAGVQSDIYSLGIVLYEMVTGRKPYMADTPAAILLKQATEPLPHPTLYAPNLPGSVEKALIKALARNPQNRFQSMADFAAALEKLAKGRQAGHTSDDVSELSALAGDTYATIEQDDSRATFLQEATFDTRSMSGVESPERTTRDTHAPEEKIKHALPVWVYALGAGIGGLVILSLCIGIALATGMIGRSSQPLQAEVPSPAVQPGNIIIPTETIPAQDPIGQQVVPTDLSNMAPTSTPFPSSASIPSNTPYFPPTSIPISNPTGKIVYACQVSGKEDFNEICLINADGSGFRQLTSNGADNGWPSLSPDGKTVFYASNKTGSYQLYKLPLSSGSEVQLTNISGQAMAPDMSPTGQIVFTLSTTSESIWVMNADGSGAHQVYRLGWDPVWSPDGNKILFATGTVSNVVHAIINADGSDFHQLANFAELRGRSDWSSLNLIAIYAGPSWGRNLYTVNVDGSNITQITTGGNGQGPSFSPDGQWIAFTGYFDNMGDINGCEIYIIRIDGTDRIRLTSNSYCDWQPRWGF